MEKLQDAEYMYCDDVLHFKGFKAHTNPPANERQSQPTAAAAGDDSQLMEIERQNHHLKQVSAARFVVFCAVTARKYFASNVGKVSKKTYEARL